MSDHETRKLGLRKAITARESEDAGRDVEEEKASSRQGRAPLPRVRPPAVPRLPPPPPLPRVRPPPPKMRVSHPGLKTPAMGWSQQRSDDVDEITPTARIRRTPPYIAPDGESSVPQFPARLPGGANTYDLGASTKSSRRLERWVLFVAVAFLVIAALIVWIQGTTETPLSRDASSITTAAAPPGSGSGLASPAPPQSTASAAGGAPASAARRSKGAPGPAQARPGAPKLPSGSGSSSPPSTMTSPPPRPPAPASNDDEIFGRRKKSGSNSQGEPR